MTGLRLRAAALALVAGAAFAVPATPSYAASCSGSSGVTVVVDFASLGGGSQTRCAAGDPDSGITALRGAGFEPTRAAQQPGYFVCRIDGKPASDPCQRTSPEDAYWSYWHARPGGSWTYSSTGPADHDPAPGTVEGWAFGAGKPPSSPPPAAAAPSASARPSPAPSPRAVVRPSPSSAPARAAAPPATVTPAVVAPSPTGTTTPSPAADSPSAAAVPSPARSTQAPSPAAAPAAEEDGGSPAGPLLAGLLLAGLAAAGTWQARLRKGRG